MAKITIESVALELADSLSPRVQDVVKQRFGLGEQKTATLEAIGKKHRITRERVRQIVEEGLRQLRKDLERKKQRQVHSLFDQFRRILRQAGSLKREDLLLELLQVRNEANHALFLLTLGDQFYNHRETRDFYPFWSLKKEMVEQASSLHGELLKLFEKSSAPLLEDRVLENFGRHAKPYLEVSKAIMRGYDGRWGLKTWPEVHPRGMRDKAYLVLKERGRPLHFMEVAKAIVKLQERLQETRQKTVLPQTVHNELIKDERFVLAGRGTYGLQEWGMRPGTVKDVLRAILKGNGKAMAKEELLKSILLERQVKESTVFLNLQDKRYFAKTPDGTYRVVR